MFNHSCVPNVGKTSCIALNVRIANVRYRGTLLQALVDRTSQDDSMHAPQNCEVRASIQNTSVQCTAHPPSFQPMPLLFTCMCDVEAGTELTISYTESDAMHTARLRTLAEDFGFSCGCDLCSAGMRTDAQTQCLIQRAERAHVRCGGWWVRVYNSHPIQHVCESEQRSIASSEWRLVCTVCASEQPV
jgi:hypothetical protein